MSIVAHRKYSTSLLKRSMIYITILTALCSSVSIVSDYRLDDWGLIPDRGREFFL
jgi:hypothetical protein